MEFLERERHLSELNEHFEQAVAGSGRVVMVGSEAGGGKTTLLNHFATQLGERTRILRASCDALSTPEPLGPVRDMAPQLGLDMQSFDPDSSRDRLFRTILDALTNHRYPTVMIGEDAHWTDGASLEMVRFLAKRIGSTRTLIVVSYRDDELGPDHPLRRTLGDLATTSSVHRMHLPPLTLDAVRQLAAASTRDPRQLHQLTGGNPFFVTELLAASDESIPATVADAVLARVARLDPEARAVLDIAAIIGSTASLDLVLNVAGPVYDEIDACVASGLIHCEPDLTFRHALVREAVLGVMTPPRRRLLHGRVLEVLREHPGLAPDLAVLAHHAEGAVDTAAVLEFAQAAAEQAVMLHAHHEAAEQYARVLRFGAGLPDRERAQLLDARSTACYLSDLSDDAIAARLASLAIWRQLGERLMEGEALRWLSRLYWSVGNGAGALTAGEQARDVLEALPPGAQLARAYSNLSQLKMLANENEAAIALGERAIAMSTELGHRETLVHALTNVGTARGVMPGLIDQGRRDLEQAFELARNASLLDDAGRALTNLAWTEYTAMNLERAEQRLDVAIAYSDEHDLYLYRAYQQATRALVRVHRGTWDEAMSDSDEIRNLTRSSPLSQLVAMTAAGWVQARRGLPEAWETLDAALAMATPTGELQRLGPIALARSEAALMAGDIDRAADEATAVASLVNERGNPWTRGAIASVLHQAGRHHAIDGPLAAPYQLLLNGEWRQAAAAWHELGCPYDEALALLPCDDAGAVRQALAMFERLAAKPAVARARARLRALGVQDLPAIRRGPQRATRANPAGLTRREAEVLDLLVEGLTRAEIAQRLYLTPKTVSHHVSAIYAKLDVANRTEAIRTAAKIGITAA